MSTNDAKTQHTPREIVRTGEGFTVYEGERGTALRRRLGVFHYEEDARQYAVFPELLEELREALEDVKGTAEYWDERLMPREKKEAQGRVERIEALLAKAEGR